MDYLYLVRLLPENTNQMHPDITFKDGKSECGCKIAAFGGHSDEGRTIYKIYFCAQHIRGRIKVRESHSRCTKKFSLCLDCGDHNYCERYSDHRDAQDKKQAIKEKHKHHLRVLAMAPKDDDDHTIPSLRF
jgi:hypothetical protein